MRNVPLDEAEGVGAVMTNSMLTFGRGVGQYSGSGFGIKFRDQGSRSCRRNRDAERCVP
jgi:hypothetical protein